ncbi:MAG: IF-2-associated domain-containing protein, partial [Pseudomonadota bacterium]|nr:IF-2-associated domain-containing protein [Pseudomonadota bacterium]
MSEVTIQSFAAQIGVEANKLLDQLEHAGVPGKSVDDSLADDEKVKLLTYLQGGNALTAGTRDRITLKRKTTREIRQTSKTGGVHTVHVEMRKRRTFVKRSVLEAQKAEEMAAAEAERKTEEEKLHKAAETEAAA